MTAPRRLILLEDNVVDAELLRRSLKEEWPQCEFTLINNREDYEAVLEKGGFDLIISDYRMPGFDGPEALAMARQRCPAVPFLFVSGAIGDEVAIESLKAGATDYVLKDRLPRLVPAIRRALTEAADRVRRHQAEADLRHSQDQHRDLLDNATDLIQSVAPDGRLLYVNPAWRKALEYTEVEVQRLTIFDVLHSEYHESWRDGMVLAKPDEPFSWEGILLAKHGRQLHVEGNTSVRFEAGKVAASRGIFHDVTEKKLAVVALKRSIREHEDLVNSVDGIVWQADIPSMRFRFVSRQAERLLGYPTSCWLDEADFWKNHIHGDDLAEAVALRAGVTADQPSQSVEYRMIAADGNVVWIRDIVSVRSEPGHAPRIQGIMVNITPRKQAEAARRDIQAQLERTNRDLLRRNQEIQNFYHTLSHELKTPLTSAREFISILQDGLAGALNETQLEYLRIAKDSCNQLHHCITDLLDATRLETGKMPLDLKPVSLAELISRAVTAMKPKAAERQTAITQKVEDGLPEIPCDEHRITQVISNLLNNALKYTPSKGHITVQAGHAPDKRELILVSVADNGYGIPKEEQEHIFDRLYQVKAGDATTEQGIGLGLYLCREFVQLHGGNIWAQSEQGKGSTFSFVLPKTQQLLRFDLLIIDDDPDMLEMLRQLLIAEQYNVRTAANGRAGLEEMRRQPPDMILLDLAMPGLNGPATLKEIRRDWSGIPVIVHTAFSDSELMKQALPFSPFTLMAKPSSPEQILETLRKVQRSGDTAVWKKRHYGLPKPRAA